MIEIKIKDDGNVIVNGKFIEFDPVTQAFKGLEQLKGEEMKAFVAIKRATYTQARVRRILEDLRAKLMQQLERLQEEDLRPFYQRKLEEIDNALNQPAE